jgi:hypothetical protein
MASDSCPVPKSGRLFFSERNRQRLCEHDVELLKDLPKAVGRSAMVVMRLGNMGGYPLGIDDIL